MEVSKVPHIYIRTGDKGAVNKATAPHHIGSAAGSGVDGAHREGLSPWVRDELASWSLWLSRFQAQSGDARLPREPFLTSGKSTPPVLLSTLHPRQTVSSLVAFSEAKTGFCCP